MISANFTASSTLAILGLLSLPPLLTLSHIEKGPKEVDVWTGARTCSTFDSTSSTFLVQRNTWDGADTLQNGRLTAHCASSVHYTIRKLTVYAFSALFTYVWRQFNFFAALSLLTNDNLCRTKTVQIWIFIAHGLVTVCPHCSRLNFGLQVLGHWEMRR